MLINFDVSLLSIKYVKIKSVSQALGGSVQIVDEEASTDAKRVYKRYSLPLSVARQFAIRYNKVTQFVIPHEGILVMYGMPGKEDVIAIEKAPTNSRYVEGLEGEEPRLWQSLFQHHFVTHHRTNHFDDGSWYIDGTFLYRFHEDSVLEAVSNAHHLDAVGQFRNVTVDAIQLAYLGYGAANALFETRNCMAIYYSDDAWSVSPPVWQTIGRVGTSKMSKSHLDKEQVTLVDQFDQVDSVMGVNLNFTLAAGRLVADLWGYDAIEPLNLPLLMLELKTVNLPNIPKETKAKFDTGFQFSHACAWLLGLLRKSDSYDQLRAVRKLLKYLTTKGIFLREQNQKKFIFVDESIERHEIPLFTREELEYELQ